MPTKKLKRGRPPKPVAELLDANLNFSCSPAMLAAVERYQLRIGFSKRADACRRLVEKGLEVERQK